MLYGFDQPSSDVACAFFKVMYRTPTVSSTSHESRFHGSNANLDISDGGIRIVVLKALANDDYGLAGFDDCKTFPDRCYDWPSRDRPPGGRVVREMDRRPRPPLMIVRQCRQGLEHDLLRVAQVSDAYH